MSWLLWTAGYEISLAKALGKESVLGYWVWNLFCAKEVLAGCHVKLGPLECTVVFGL